jgi:hypothetical protein
MFFYDYSVFFMHFLKKIYFLHNYGKLRITITNYELRRFFDYELRITITKIFESLRITNYDYEKKNFNYDASLLTIDPDMQWQ